MSSLEKCLFRSFAHFFDWVVYFFMLSCMDYLYILEINLMSLALFANIFFYSEKFFFVLFMVSLAVQNLLSFIWSHLFVFLFSLLWEVDQKNVLL